jgi:tetratricopeptide (TPR) repeat protein
LGQLEKAKQAHRRAADISPALGNPTRARLAAALADRVRKEVSIPRDSVEFAIGERLLENGYLDEAIDYLRRDALHAPSGNSYRHHTLHTALLRRGQYAAALRLERLTNSRIPADAAAWRAVSRRHIEYLERAPELDALRREALKHEAAFRRRPDDPDAGRTLVAAYNRLSEDPKPVREWLDPGVTLPDDPGLWCNLGGLLLLEGDGERHARLCRHAAEYTRRWNEGSGWAYVHAVQIVRLWGMDGKLSVDTARMLALARKTSVPQYEAGRLHALGLACYRAGKYEEAVRHLNECVKDHPEWGAQVLNYQVLALTYHRLGKGNEAQRWRARATAWIDETAEEIGRAAPYAWPLEQHDLLAMWLLERELARELPKAGP